jgi:hypothetical protein
MAIAITVRNVIQCTIFVVQGIEYSLGLTGGNVRASLADNLPTERKHIFVSISFATAKELLQPIIGEIVQSLHRTPIAAPAKRKKVKPIGETRLWKLSAVSPQRAAIELFALIVFLTFALVGCWSCFAELSQLLDNDALGWFARKALAGARR